ncbi:MAG: sigma-70 family RNA polymerase sigma factor [Oscillospiraceae bacterium]|jgi:RNA polymerase sigma-70 factor (ECF subfamily)|nr:sigma-70 family RNA polymerase sigma factor [Oscillospiraceae bacterium]
MSDKGLTQYEAYLRGDEYALEELVHRYSDPLIRYIYCFVQDASTAEELMEDTIVTLIMKRKRLDTGDKLHGYLYKIARNKAIDHLRWRKRFVPLEDLQNVLSTGSLEDDHTRRARDEAVYACIQALPSQYRQILHLTWFEGFSLPESAKIMGKSAKQIYNLHTRAKAALKSTLIKEGIDHEDL